jgi:hypothetical protein
MMTRRDFNKRFAGILLMFSSLGSALLQVACWTAQQWFDLISALLPILGQTYLQFYGFASKGGVDPADVALVQRLTTAGQDAITRIQGIITAVKAGDQSRLGELKSVLTALQADVNGFLTDAQIKNSAHFNEYSGFAQALLADVTDIIGLVPVITPVKAIRGAVRVAVPTEYHQAKALPAIFKERLAHLPT